MQRHIDLGSKMQVSGWRRIAAGSWGHPSDPSVYGILDVDAKPLLADLERRRQETGLRVTLTHLVGKALALTIQKHPSINCILRFGNFYPRKQVDIFFQVATDTKGNDLGGMVIRNASDKTIGEISSEMEAHKSNVKQFGDQAFAKMKKLFRSLPYFLPRVVTELSGFVLYSLNIWSRFFNTPKDSFGSAMITNIGSLGLDCAFAPLVPYSRCPLIIALGSVKDVPVIEDGIVVPGKRISLCVTFDHRLIDGMHASAMAKTLTQLLKNPEVL